MSYFSAALNILVCLYQYVRNPNLMTTLYTGHSGCVTFATEEKKYPETEVVIAFLSIAIPLQLSPTEVINSSVVASLCLFPTITSL